MFTRIDLRGHNNFHRDDFVSKELKLIKPGKLLVVGSGERPYKEIATSLGFQYISHDFEQYEGNENNPGLQNDGWDNKGHDIVSDILDIPSGRYGTILLTEVLEHIPDPLAALSKCASLLEKNGILLITVPFASRMHQAPFWYSAGLSPYWFEFHSKNLGLQAQEVCLLGNFYDMFLAEVHQFFGSISWKRFNLGLFLFGILKKLRVKIEPRIPSSLLDSGALGVFVILKKQ
jgi:SAM-dependent methyltransferase